MLADITHNLFCVILATKSRNEKQRILEIEASKNKMLLVLGPSAIVSCFILHDHPFSDNSIVLNLLN